MSGLAPLLVSPSTALAAASCSILARDQKKTSPGVAPVCCATQICAQIWECICHSTNCKRTPGKSDNSTAGLVKRELAIGKDVEHCVLEKDLQFHNF